MYVEDTESSTSEADTPPVQVQDGHKVMQAARILAPVNTERMALAAGQTRFELSSPPASPFAGTARLLSPISPTQLSDSHTSVSSGERPRLIKLVHQGDLAGIQAYVAQSPLEKHAEVVDDHKANALHLAASNYDIAIVEWLLEQGSFDVNAQDADGDTALHRAVGVGHRLARRAARSASTGRSVDRHQSGGHGRPNRRDRAAAGQACPTGGDVRGEEARRRPGGARLRSGAEPGFCVRPRAAFSTTTPSRKSRAGSTEG